MNILWVENHDRFSRLAVKTFLCKHKVTVVPSLMSARQALAAEIFDLVLLDYDLDDGKGAELVAEVKALPHRPGLIATSSHAFGNQSLRKAGADAVCGKTEFTNIGQVIASLTLGELALPLTNEPPSETLAQELVQWQELSAQTWEAFPHEDDDKEKEK